MAKDLLCTTCTDEYAFDENEIDKLFSTDLEDEEETAQDTGRLNTSLKEFKCPHHYGNTEMVLIDSELNRAESLYRYASDADSAERYVDLTARRLESWNETLRKTALIIKTLAKTYNYFYSIVLTFRDENSFRAFRSEKGIKHFLNKLQSFYRAKTGKKDIAHLWIALVMKSTGLPQYRIVVATGEFVKFPKPDTSFSYGLTHIRLLTKKPASTKYLTRRISGFFLKTIKKRSTVPVQFAKSKILKGFRSWSASLKAKDFHYYVKFNWKKILYYMKGIAFKYLGDIIYDGYNVWFKIKALVKFFDVGDYMISLNMFAKLDSIRRCLRNYRLYVWIRTYRPRWLKFDLSLIFQTGRIDKNLLVPRSIAKFVETPEDLEELKNSCVVAV